MLGISSKGWLDSTPPKAAFTFGLILGVGLMALIGLIFAISLFMKGGISIDGKESAATGNTKPVAAAPRAATAPSPAANAVDIEVTDKDHIRGNPNAKVTIIEFSDFECPFCGRFAPTVKQALDEYSDDVRLVYKHFPLDSIHPQARPAAEASECAAEQGKFWEFHDALFENQTSLSANYYPQLAGELGIDTGKFNDCLTSGRFAQKVEDDYQLGLSVGARGTPYSLVNGQPVSGAVPFAQLKQAIDAALAL